MLRRPCTALLAAALLVWPCSLAASPGRFPAHYLVFGVDSEGEVRPLFHRPVRLAGAPAAVSAEDLERARRSAASGEPLLVLEVVVPGGAVAFRDVVRLPGVLRGEFHDEELAGGGWTIQGVRVPLPVKAFAARVPAVPRARLVVDGLRRFVFGLDDLADASSHLPLAPLVADLEARPLNEPDGDPANRVDYLIMGDGYAAQDQGRFETDAAGLEAEFFGITPLHEYRPFVNVTRLFTESPESGADHPPYDPGCQDSRFCCRDPAMTSDPLAGQMVDTAFDGRFCTSHIHRLLTVDYPAILAAAAAVPDWDHILVLVNDETYGGSGGAIAVSSTHAAAVDIMRHEVGHSFSRLADEYECCGPPGGCQEAYGSCRPNVTDETNPALIKWSPWILPTTPIPTPESDPAYYSLVGLFEGAQYVPTGTYRPRNVCLMRALGVDFGEICAQEYVLRLYQGGWGIPVEGVDPIEPGSESPPPGPITTDARGVSFGVDLLEPDGGPPLHVEWRVDDTPVDGASSSTFRFIPDCPGLFFVQLLAEDVTPLVHGDMAGTDLSSSREWSVEAPGAELRIELSGSGSGSVTSRPAGIDCGVDCEEDCVVRSRVFLTVQPATGSLFAGWSGHSDCSDGVLTMDSDRTCIATFETCGFPNEVVLADMEIDTETVVEACHQIWVGPNCTVTGTGNLILHAGELIGFVADVTTEPGGRVAALVGPPWAGPPSAASRDGAVE